MRELPTHCSSNVSDVPRQCGHMDKLKEHICPDLRYFNIILKIAFGMGLGWDEGRTFIFIATDITILFIIWVVKVRLDRLRVLPP